MKNVLAVACLVFAASMEAALTSHSYVQRGLVAAYDGIDNQGTGTHDETARTWVDVTGHGNDGALDTNVTWGDTGWVNSREGFPVKVTSTGLAEATASGHFTIELACRPSVNQRMSLFSQHDQPMSMSFEYNGGKTPSGGLRTYFWPGGVGNDLPSEDNNNVPTLAANEAGTLHITADMYRIRSGKNGTLTWRQDHAWTSWPLSPTNQTMLGGEYNNRSSQAFRGTFNSVRVYDVVLTEDEIAVNAAVDAIRYRGAAPSVFTLGGGYSFSAEGDLQFSITAEVQETLGGTVRLGEDGEPATCVAVTNVVDATSATVSFTALPAEGYRFCGWMGDTDEIVSGTPQSATIEVRAAWAVMLRPIFRPDVTEIPRAADLYVTDGLVVWYDGIENAGHGVHSDSTRTWADLTGGGHDGILASGISWVANGWTNNADCKSSVMIGSAFSPALNSKRFTLDFAVRPNETGTRGSYFSQYSGSSKDEISIERNLGTASDGRLRVYLTGENDFSVANLTVKGGESATVSLLSDVDVQACYKNGAQARRQVKAFSNTFSATKSAAIGGEFNRASQGFRGVYHAFRGYNRPLAPSELLQNALADSIRLYNADGYTLGTAAGAWMDSECWSRGVPATDVAAYLLKAAPGTTVMTVDDEVETVTNVVVMNTQGTTKIDIASDGVLPFENAWLTIGKGGRIDVAAGGRLAYRGSGVSKAGEHRVEVASGLLRVDGGRAKFSDFGGNFAICGSEAHTGVVSIVSGLLHIEPVNYNDSVLIGSYGRFEVAGGTAELAVQNPNGSRYLITQGGDLVVSGSGVLKTSNSCLGFGAGTVTLTGSARLTNYLRVQDQWGWKSNQIVQDPGAGERCVVTVKDNARFTYEGDLNDYKYFVGVQRDSYSELNWDSTATLDVKEGFSVGFDQGTGVVHLTKGTIKGRGGYGVRIGAYNNNTNAYGHYPVGIVNVAGGCLIGAGNGATGNNNGTCVDGLSIGRGLGLDLAKADLGFYRGTLNVSAGAVTNLNAYFLVGVGVAEGTVVQTGGTISQATPVSPSFGTYYEQIIGAWGGTGRWIVSNGVTRACGDVYVGGMSTNQLRKASPALMYRSIPVTNHRAQGLLEVAGGSFTADGDLWISQDGAGVLALGPSGTVTAANVILANTPASLTGGAPLAAQVRVTTGPESVGVAQATDKLTIGTGVTLSVDSTALTKSGRFPLLRFAQCEGEFTLVSVTGHGAVVKIASGADAGYWLDNRLGTMILFR